MTHAVSPALVVQTVSALLYIALGAWVLTLRPRRLQTVLLGAFAVLFGLIYAPLDILLVLDLVESPSLVQALLQEPLGILASIVALWLVWAVPEPLEDQRLLGAALTIGFALVILHEAVWLASPLVYTGPFPQWIASSSYILGAGAAASALLLLAFRARPARNPDPSEVTQLAILGVALAAFGAFLSGSAVLRTAAAVTRGQALLAAEGALELLGWFVVAGLWGWNMLRANEDTVRIHRTVLLAILGLVTAGALYFAVFPGASPYQTAMRGVMRTVGVALLAYGILRHDLAGLDEKVEWGISRTTVAGVFVAVFFIVSEGAQVLFAGFAGSEWLGILAAGALLFALSPIQRVADHIAERAVPSTGRGPATGPEARYRTALEAALADGEVTRDEERFLAELADELGLPATRVLEIREDVEAREPPRGG